VIIIFTAVQSAFGTYLLSIAVLLVFFFIWTWNEFFIPLVMLVSNENQTVPVALGVLQGQRLMDATMQSASALLGIVPAVLFFLVFQRTLTRGIAAGAVK
jgi:raffinose/stachyose/melibiose transport system permease protein